MAKTSTGNTKVSGTIVTGNAVDGASINGDTSNISLNPIGSLIGENVGDTGADTIETNSGDNAENNISRLVIPNGATVTINGKFSITEGSQIVMKPHSTLNIGDASFTAGDEAITYTHSNVSTYQTYSSCKFDNILGDYNDDDHDTSGSGMAVMGDEALPLVDAIGC